MRGINKELTDLDLREIKGKGEQIKAMELFQTNEI